MKIKHLIWASNLKSENTNTAVLQKQVLQAVGWQYIWLFDPSNEFHCILSNILDITSPLHKSQKGNIIS